MEHRSDFATTIKESKYDFIPNNEISNFYFSEKSSLGFLEPHT